jgi:hypothetical protein
MKAKHHFWSSLAAGGALYYATGSSAAITGSMLGGFLIDSDHLIDQLWSISRDAPYLSETAGGNGDSRGARACVARYLRRRKLVRLPLIFHSYELLAALIILTASARTAFVIGLLAGYSLHLLLDLIRHHHEFRSPLFYLLFYRMAQGFRRDRLIKAEFL